MKKVVLSSVVALSLFALAVPAFAADEATNAARQGDPEYYLQTEFTWLDILVKSEQKLLKIQQ